MNQVTIWFCRLTTLLAFAAALFVGRTPVFASEGPGCNVTITIKNGNTTIGTWTNGTGAGSSVLLAKGVNYTYSASCDCAGHIVTLETPLGTQNPITATDNVIALCISNAIGRLSVVQASSLQSSNWQAGCLPHFPPSCITYAEGYNSTTENDTIVTATCNTSQQKSIARYTVVGGAINPATVRIPPNVPQDRPVQIAPTLTAPRSVALDVIRTAGTAGAAFVDPTTVTETTSVCLDGTEQTNVGNPKNMRLREKVTADVVVTYDDFTVCAHPTGVAATYDSIPARTSRMEARTGG